MNNDLDPIVGNWYRHLDKGRMFTVVTVDDLDGVIVNRRARRSR